MSLVMAIVVIIVSFWDYKTWVWMLILSTRNLVHKGLAFLDGSNKFLHFANVSKLVPLSF
jgi:hypothetical protein